MGEITNGDCFGRAIFQTIVSQRYRSVLEIGSHDGTGSTQTFIAAISASSDIRRLVCLEPNPRRFEQLKKAVSSYPWVEAKQMPSISAASFTPKQFDADVWESPYNALRYQRCDVEKWWEETTGFYATSGPGYLETTDDTFDAILIDGDEFSGYDDYRLAKDRCRCLMLDDVHHAYKCNRAHRELFDDPAWSLLWLDPYVRNGAAIWIRQ